MVCILIYKILYFIEMYERPSLRQNTIQMNKKIKGGAVSFQIVDCQFQVCYKYRDRTEVYYT